MGLFQFHVFSIQLFTQPAGHFIFSAWHGWTCWVRSGMGFSIGVSHLSFKSRPLWILGFALGYCTYMHVS